MRVFCRRLKSRFALIWVNSPNCFIRENSFHAGVEKNTFPGAVMKIHEYQGKELLRQFNVPVPNGIPAFSVDEAIKAAEKLGGPVWVVKAQIHAGGRGKGWRVKLARSMEEVKNYASSIFGMQLKTHQTGPEGQKVRRLLIEDGADIKKEYYLGILTDRGTQKVVLMASSEGGMDIEEVAESPLKRLLKYLWIQ
jgi:succinyl-CoA synthetase beta subunit